MALQRDDPLGSLAESPIDLIVFDDPDGPRDVLGDLARCTGQRVLARVPWSALDVTLALVARGLGAAMLPALAARACAGDRIRLWDLGSEAPARDLACVWHADRERTDAHRAVVEALRAASTAELGPPAA